CVGVDGNARLARWVEPHLLQVDVRDVTAKRILLVVLEDRRVRRLLSFEDDVENRVEAARARQDAAKLALRDADGVRLLAVAVEDAGDEPFVAEAPSARRAAVFPLLDLQFHAFAGHRGVEW